MNSEERRLNRPPLLTAASVGSAGTNGGAGGSSCAEDDFNVNSFAEGNLESLRSDVGQDKYQMREVSRGLNRQPDHEDEDDDDGGVGDDEKTRLVVQNHVSIGARKSLNGREGSVRFSVVDETAPLPAEDNSTEGNLGLNEEQAAERERYLTEVRSALTAESGRLARRITRSVSSGSSSSFRGKSLSVGDLRLPFGRRRGRPSSGLRAKRQPLTRQRRRWQKLALLRQASSMASEGDSQLASVVAAAALAAGAGLRNEKDSFPCFAGITKRVLSTTSLWHKRKLLQRKIRA